MSDAFASLLHREATRQAMQENKSRLAWSFNRVTSTGWGEFKISQRLDFDTAFIEEPFMHYGCSLNGEALVATRFPRTWGYVTDWDQDSQGNYTGCWVALVVETTGSQITTTVTTDPGYTIEHHFSFAAVAAKTIPVYLLKG